MTLVYQRRGRTRRMFKVFTRGAGESLRSKTPGAKDPSEEQPKRMERLCFRRTYGSLISESKAAEILGISVRSLTRLMDQPSLA